MDIQYLKMLNDYPVIKRDNSEFVMRLIPIDESEIASLENTYNNSNSFPKALKELLFLAGKNCHVFEYGLSGSQDAMQQKERNYMIKNGKSISRPFFVIDVYNGPDQFLFIYLDESQNPIVYEAVFDLDTDDWIHSLNKTLSEYIDRSLIELLNGQNPF